MKRRLSKVGSSNMDHKNYQKTNKSLLRGSKVRIKNIVLCNFCDNISIMLKSGVSLVDALATFNENYHCKLLNIIVEKIIKELKNGVSFSVTIQKYQKYFPNLFIMMIKTGEESGQIVETLDYLKKYYYSEYQLGQKVKNALVYPTMLLGISAVIVIILLYYIIPRFTTIFENFNLQEIPKITKIIFGISAFLRKNILIVVLTICIIFLIIKALGKLGKNITIDYLKTKTFIYGKIQKWLITSRFTRSLSILYTSGVPLFSALEKAVEIIDNRYIRKKLELVNARVYQGQKLSSAISETRYFPRMMIEMIKIGEQSNNLDDVLKSTADYYDSEASSKTAKLTKIIEPTMIVILAVLITLVVIAVFLPLLKLMNEMVDI